MKLERVGVDAIPEEEWDAEAYAALHYEVDIEGPESLADFLDDTPWKVQDRVSLPDTAEVLRLVATLDPSLSDEAERILRERTRENHE